MPRRFDVGGFRLDRLKAAAETCCNRRCSGDLQGDVDPLFWLALGAKLLLTAVIVVSASVVVERAGPFIGALVVTLPVTVWPAYVFLAIEHDVSHLAHTARSGLAVNAASAVFMLIYLVLAQSRGIVVSLGAAFAAWVVLARLALVPTWGVLDAAILNVVVYAACLRLGRRYREVELPQVARQWYELPMRTALVCVLMGAVLGTSHWAGPAATGLLSVYPISTTCTMLIVHTRVGGRASAAVIANGLWGLLGIGGGLFALAAAVVPWGKGVALALGLAVPVAWNLSIWAARRRRMRAPA